MISFQATLLKFQENGEKTGWTYFLITAAQAEQLQPGRKTAFRVKGRLDDHQITGVSLIPMGGGDFIMAVNASMRKAIGKQKGATVHVRLEADNRTFTLPPYIRECLDDEPAALRFFNSLAQGHQRYFTRWVESAKTDLTRTKRLAQMVDALSKGWGYPEMIRANKKGDV